MQNIMLLVQSHILLSVAVLIVLGLLIIIEWIKLKRGADTLSPALAIQQLNHANALVVDIRSAELFLKGHIIDAVSLPAVSEDSIKKLNPFKARHLIIADSAGVESSRAAEIISRAGFKVSALTGGMRAWKEAGMPVIKN